MTELLTLSVAVLAIATAVCVAVADIRRRRSFLALACFLLSSILFVNLGFVYLWLSGAKTIWAIDGVVATSFGLLAVCAGGFVASGVSRSQWRDAAPSPREIAFPAALAVAAVVLAVSVYPFVARGEVPILSGLSELLNHGFTTGLVNSYRISVDYYVNPSIGYLPLQGLAAALRQVGLPVVIIWFVDFARRGQHRSQSILVVLICTGVIIMTGQRWPLMDLLIALSVYGFATVRDTRTRRRLLAAIALTAAAAGIVLSTLLGRGAAIDASALTALLAGVGDLITRVITGNATIPFESYRLFHSEYGLLWGSTWIQNLMAYLPGPGASYPVTFSQLVTGSTQGFTAPPDFYTEAYLNFGWAGVCGMGFAWGLCLGRMDQLLGKLVRRQAWAGTAAIMATYFGLVSVSGIVFALDSVVFGVLCGLAAIALTRVMGRGEAPRAGQPQGTRDPGDVPIPATHAA